MNLRFEISYLKFLSSGDPCVAVPPVPIPNTEVKRLSADGSASLGCARVGRCQSYPVGSVKTDPAGPFFFEEEPGLSRRFPRLEFVNF